MNLSKIEEKFKELYLKNFSYSLENIIHNLSEFDINLVYQVIHKFIIKKNILFDPYLRKCYIIYKKINNKQSILGI